MRVLLDTCAFIDSIFNPEKLGREARDIIGNDDNERLLSTVSVSELGVLTSVGRLEMKSDQLSQFCEDLKLRLLPYTYKHAVGYFSLKVPPREHPDPFDRMIVAAALAENVPVVTSDRRFQLHAGLTVVGY
jgi:PIN domain nuclease of toxin-antitoxin system